LANEHLASILISISPLPIPESWLTELRAMPEIPQSVYEPIAGLRKPEGYLEKVKFASRMIRFQKRWHKWKKKNKVIIPEHDLLKEAQEAGLEA
jgi:hypothetical protein